MLSSIILVVAGAIVGALIGVVALLWLVHRGISDAVGKGLGW